MSYFLLYRHFNGESPCGGSKVRNKINDVPLLVMQGQTFKNQYAQEAYSLQLLSKRTIHTDKEPNFICILHGLKALQFARKKYNDRSPFTLSIGKTPGFLQAHPMRYLLSHPLHSTSMLTPMFNKKNSYVHFSDRGIHE